MWTDPGSTPPQYALDQLVLVDLDLVFGPPPADVEPNPDGRLVDGLVLTGKVPGRLRKWGRAADGRRVGLVDFTICDRDSATVVRGHQVVPAEALTEVELPPQR
jgi:hypothetical protein